MHYLNILKKEVSALARWFSYLEHPLVHQGLWDGSRSGDVWVAINRCFSLTYPEVKIKKKEEEEGGS